MTRHDSRRGASNLGIPLMVLSFAAIVGLMYWLSITAEPTQVEIVEEDAPEEQLRGTLVNADVLEGPAITGYEGMTLRVENLPFAQALGETQFFANLPQGSPFLIRLGQELIDAGTTVTGPYVTVIGVLHPRTDSVLAAWQEDGSVDDANLMLVEFAAHYIEAQEIIPGAPPAPEAGAGDEPGGEG